MQLHNESPNLLTGETVWVFANQTAHQLKPVCMWVQKVIAKTLVTLLEAIAIEKGHTITSVQFGMCQVGRSIQ